MSEELTVVDYAKKAGQLNDGKKITLEGVVKGDIIANKDGKEDFDGSYDVKIKTEFDEETDITKTKISIEEPSLKEGIQAKEKIGELLWKIKDKLDKLDKIDSNLENKLEKTGNAASASNAYMLDGQHGSYFAPIENPIFKEDVEVQGVLKTQQKQLLPLSSISRTAIDSDVSYVHVCTLPFDSNGTIYLYSDGGYVVESIEIKILGGSSTNNRLEVKASKHLKEYGITKVYLYAKKNHYESDMDIYVQFKQKIKNANNIYLLYGDMIYHNSIVNKLSFVETLPTDKVLLDKIIISNEKGIYKNIEQTSLTPLIDDKSNKIATTEFVHDNFIQYQNTFKPSQSNKVNMYFVNSLNNSKFDGWTGTGISTEIDNEYGRVLKLSVNVQNEGGFMSSPFDVLPNEICEFIFAIKAENYNNGDGLGIYIGVSRNQNCKEYRYNKEINSFTLIKQEQNSYFLHNFTNMSYTLFKTYILGYNCSLKDVPTDISDGISILQLTKPHTSCFLRTGFNFYSKERIFYFAIPQVFSLGTGKR